MSTIEQIFVVGFNHDSIHTNDRNNLLRFIEKDALCSSLEEYNINAINVLQTCNRWELYGHGSIEGAKKLLLKFVNTNIDDNQILSLSNIDALHHIFKVASGLDSMVLGDQEILSQFKKSFIESKKKNTLNGFMERLANTSLKAAKEVRKNTSLTKGTTSLSYAIVHILKEIEFRTSDSILLIGLGKFGNSILKNIKTYFPEVPLTICNRTIEKSILFSEKYDCDMIPWENCNRRLGYYTLVISAINSEEILFSKSTLESTPKYIVDLSMPTPFDRSLRETETIKYFTIDDAAKIVNKCLKDRKDSIAPAMEIIDEHIKEFINWSITYSHSDVLKDWKRKLKEASNVCPFFQSIDKEESNYYLQKSMGNFAKYVKTKKASEDSEKVLFDYLKSSH